MKKRGMLVLGLFLIINFFGFISADSCTLNVSLINQDPYPAIPGESVKVVFQIDGVSNPTCGDVNFAVKENYPFTIDPESANPITISSGTYLNKYSSFYLAPYKLRVDKDALDGDTPIEVSFSSGSLQQFSQVKEFNINIKDTRADFEVYVKDYNAKARTFTLEILNIAKVDVQGLTIEIPKQPSVEIKGANTVIVGNLDSNEYTTADFEGTMDEGNLTMNIYYTDSINVRREINKTISFDPSYFTDLNRDKISQPIWLYVLIAVVLAFAGWIWYRKKKANKKNHKKF